MSGRRTRLSSALQRHVDDTGPRTEVLVFELAGEAYGIRVDLVSEILRPPPITDVPRAPAAIRGVVSVRGRLSTVVDLRARLKLPPARIENKSRLLLVSHKGETLALLVDEVREVQRLGEAEIEPAVALGADQPAYIWGIARPKAGPLTVLLDVRPLLEDIS